MKRFHSFGRPFSRKCMPLMPAGKVCKVSALSRSVRLVATQTVTLPPMPKSQDSGEHKHTCTDTQHFVRCDNFDHTALNTYLTILSDPEHAP